MKPEYNNRFLCIDTNTMSVSLYENSARIDVAELDPNGPTNRVEYLHNIEMYRKGFYK